MKNTFRDLTRKKQQLSNDECIEVLIKEKRGVLSVIGDNDYPYGTPINHYYNEDDHCVYFHCGKVGHRLDSLKRNNKASFCTYTQGEKCGESWWLQVKSVIIFGNIEIIDDIETVIDISRKLSKKFTLDNEYIEKEINSYAKNTLLLKLTPKHICGKIITEA